MGFPNTREVGFIPNIRSNFISTALQKRIKINTYI